MKKLSTLNESIWGDVLDRSTGERVRKEDDINNFDMIELYNYIYDIYVPVNPDILPTKSQTNKFGHECFSLPIFKNKKSLKQYRLYASFKNGKITKLSLMASMKDIEDFKQELLDNFTVMVGNDGILNIFSKEDLGKVSNQLCMDLIQVIVDNAPEPLLKRLKRER